MPTICKHIHLVAKCNSSELPVSPCSSKSPYSPKLPVPPYSPKTPYSLVSTLPPGKKRNYSQYSKPQLNNSGKSKVTNSKQII